MVSLRYYEVLSSVSIAEIAVGLIALQKFMVSLREKLFPFSNRQNIIFIIIHIIVIFIHNLTAENLQL